MMVSLGGNFWICLCWMAVLFLGFCFLLVFWPEWSVVEQGFFTCVRGWTFGSWYGLLLSKGFLPRLGSGVLMADVASVLAGNLLLSCARSSSKHGLCLFGQWVSPGVGGWDTVMKGKRTSEDWVCWKLTGLWLSRGCLAWSSGKCGLWLDRGCLTEGNKVVSIKIFMYLCSTEFNFYFYLEIIVIEV